MSEGREARGEASTVLGVVRLIASRPAFIFMMLATACSAFATNGLGVWLPAFFMRSHGMTSGVAGSWVAALNFGGTVGGAIAGGLIVDRLCKRDRRWAMWFPAATYAIAAPLSLFGFLAPNLALGVTCIAVPYLFFGTIFGPVYSTVPALVGLRMRAMAFSIFLLFVNLIGLGLGPWVIGVLSDQLADAGAESLRHALAFVLPPILLSAAGLYLWAASKLREDLNTAPP
jgi:MFS family permease